MATFIQRTMAVELAPAISQDKELMALLREGAQSEENARMSWAKVYVRMGKDFGTQMDAWPIPGTELKDGALYIGDTLVVPAPEKGSNVALVPDRWEETILTADGPKPRTFSFYEELWDRTDDGVENREQHSAVDTNPAFADDKAKSAEKGRLNAWRLSNIKQLRRAARFHLKSGEIMELLPRITVRLEMSKVNKDQVSGAPKNIRLYDDKGEATVVSYGTFVKYEPKKALAAAGDLPANVGLSELVATNKRGTGEGQDAGRTIMVKNVTGFQKAAIATAQYVNDVMQSPAGRKAWEKAFDDDATLIAARDLVSCLTTYVKRPDMAKRIAAIDEAVDAAEKAERDAKAATAA